MRIHEIIEGRAPAAPRGASLYHGTSCLAAAEIIQSGIIKASSDGHGVGVSLTDTWGSADEFASRKDSEDATFLAHLRQHGHADDYEEDFAASMQSYPHLTGVVFELDTAKVMTAYRVRAVDYSGDWEIEEEWRVMNADVVLQPVLRRIHVKPEVIQWWMDHHPDRQAALQRLVSR